MLTRRPLPVMLLLAALVLSGLGGLAAPALAAPALPLVDDFEFDLELPSGTDANGVALGFSTFQDPNSQVAISLTSAPPAAVPGALLGDLLCSLVGLLDNPLLGPQGLYAIIVAAVLALILP